MRISFNGANLVAWRLDWNMTGDWGQGDRATNAYFAPIETFEPRFDEYIGLVSDAGFDIVDVWSAQLNHEWATPAHVEAARRVLDKRSMTVCSYGGWFGSTPAEFRRSNEIVSALGARILGGGTSLLASDRASALSVLAESGNILGIENHPEKTPQDLVAQIGEDHDGLVAATVDTGWFGTQGYDAAEAIRELGPLVVHVHLKDVRAAGEHETCAYGEGVVPIADCVTALREIGYDGVISIEHEPEHGDPFPAIEASRKQLVELLS